MLRIRAVCGPRNRPTTSRPGTPDISARAKEVVDEPQAFRVDMSPGRVTKAHFHVVDQFQMLVAGERGFACFTLRPQVDTGPVYLDRPDFREQLKPSKKRHHTVTDVVLAIDPVMQAREETLLEPLFAAEADGLLKTMSQINSQRVWLRKKGKDQ